MEFEKEGTFEIEFQVPTADDKTDLSFNGIDIYLFCDDYIDSFMSALNFFMMFMDLPGDKGPIPQFVEDATAAFLNETMNWQPEIREI